MRPPKQRVSGVQCPAADLRQLFATTMETFSSSPVAAANLAFHLRRVLCVPKFEHSDEPTFWPLAAAQSFF